MTVFLSAAPSSCLHLPELPAMSRTAGIRVSLASFCGNPARAEGGRAWSSDPATDLRPSPAGLPKAARISHLKILQCQGFYQLCGAHQGDVIYLAIPLYHMSGSLLGIVGCLGIGQSLPLPPRPSLPHPL